ncbi:MAG: glycosyltransferase family 2 protein [Nitrospirae bacterium]|nr:glycosyltransferase family 2 protein [Nitrospirota bacterium]
MKILVVIPAYNESENISDVIDDLRQDFPQGDSLIINDGSEDETSSVARSLDCRVIDLPYNIGIGGSVQTGIIYAIRENFDVVVQFDGDGQHIAMEIEKILAPVSEGADIVIGSRFLGGNRYTSSIIRKMGITIFARIMSLICGQKLTDTTSGFRAYGRKAIDLFSDYYPEDYPEVEALILAHKNNLIIREVPAAMRQRIKGKSSITPLRSIYYMVKVLLAVFVDILKK